MKSMKCKCPRHKNFACGWYNLTGGQIKNIAQCRVRTNDLIRLFPPLCKAESSREFFGLFRTLLQWVCEPVTTTTTTTTTSEPTTSGTTTETTSQGCQFSKKSFQESSSDSEDDGENEPEEENFTIEVQNGQAKKLKFPTPEPLTQEGESQEAETQESAGVEALQVTMGDEDDENDQDFNPCHVSYPIRTYFCHYC